MEFVKFAHSTTSVKVENVLGLQNGYKINEVVHGGRRICLRNQNYFYVPSIKQVVSYKATSGKIMKINKARKFNFQETIEGGYHKTVHVGASELFEAAAQYF
jgi:hypothetical protein